MRIKRVALINISCRWMNRCVSETASARNVMNVCVIKVDHIYCHHLNRGGITPGPTMSGWPICKLAQPSRGNDHCCAVPSSFLILWLPLPLSAKKSNGRWNKPIHTPTKSGFILIWNRVHLQVIHGQIFKRSMASMIIRMLLRKGTEKSMPSFLWSDLKRVNKRSRTHTYTWKIAEEET